jgi:hypothetical protein
MFMDKRFEVEVGAYPVRDPKTETPLYRIPDPENWEAFYKGSRKQLMDLKDENGNLSPVVLDKCIVITKGAEPKKINVNEHLLNFLKADRNIYVRVLPERKVA